MNLLSITMQCIVKYISLKIFDQLLPKFFDTE